MPAIATKDVRKVYGDHVVLDDLCFTVEEGELLALMGPNGAGKSTLMACLVGSEQPDAGQISTFGHTNPKKRGDDVAVLFQDAMLEGNLTGLENFKFYSQIEAADRAQFEELIDRFRLTDSIHEPTRTYSGGMKRKLELAITLSVDARGYLLDEPTAGVDLSMIGLIHRTIRDKVEDGQMVILTSHQPIDIQMADRVAFLTDGTISHSDYPDDLIEQLPTTVRLPDLKSAAAAVEYVQSVYYVGAETRAFLDDGNIDAVRRAVNERTGRGNLVEEVRPGYADAFEYYTQ